MIRRVVVLSGPVGAGKTTLADELKTRFGVHTFKTKNYLKDLAGSGNHSRKELQDKGESLDRATRGNWVAQGACAVSSGLPRDAVLIVDAVRIPSQVRALRKAFGQNLIHVHLTAPIEDLQRRYAERGNSSGITEFDSYSKVRENKTEAVIDRLGKDADVVIDTKLCTAQDVIARAAAHIGLYGQDGSKCVDVFVGAQYGSEGKGNIISHVAADYHLLVRVGGPNAGHQVFGEPIYTHHHLPSGTRRGNAEILLSPGMVINVDKLLQEIADCQVESDRLSIDPNAMIIEQRDIDAEKELAETIGSTAQGVGAATARKIMWRGKEKLRLARDIRQLKPFIRSAYEVLENAYARHCNILLEGTQGTGLSIHHGLYPYVTSRDCSVAGALSEAGISPTRVRRVVMVVRTYPIRVQDPAEGTSGYMSQPLTWEEIARRSGIDVATLKTREKTSTTKRQRRVAEFDWAMVRRAAALNGPTDIALTFADYFGKGNSRARRFEQLTPKTQRFVEELEKVTCARVSLISVGFSERCIIDRRQW